MWIHFQVPLRWISLENHQRQGQVPIYKRSITLPSSSSVILFDAWFLALNLNTSRCPQHTFDNCSLKAQRGLGFISAKYIKIHDATQICNDLQHRKDWKVLAQVDRVYIRWLLKAAPGSVGPFSCKFLQASVAITRLLRLLATMATVSQNCRCSGATANWWLLVRPASQSRMLNQNHSDVATLCQWVAGVVSIPNLVFSLLIWHGTTGLLEK